LKYSEYHIDKRQVEWIFAPLRSKSEVIELLMKTIKIMLVNDTLDKEIIAGKIVLCVSKMSRLFYYSENKYFSITFPFTVLENEDGISFQSKHLTEVDHKATSDVLSVLTAGGVLAANDIMDFAEPVLDISEYNDGFWCLLRDLFLFDDGYIRYDYDEKHENGLIHPLNHLDIFYSASSTFKIGLKNKIKDTHLLDLLDIKSNCHYLDTV